MRKSILKGIISLGLLMASVLMTGTISYANEDSFSVVGNPNLFGEVNPDSTSLGWVTVREEQVMTKVKEMEGVYKYTGNYVVGKGEFDELYKLNYPDIYAEDLKERTQFKILYNGLEEGWSKQMCMGYSYEEWDDNQSQFLIEEIKAGEYDIYLKPSKGFVCVIQDGEILPLKLRYKSKDEDCTKFVEPTEEGIAEYIALSKDSMGYKCKLNDNEYELFKKECLAYANNNYKNNKIVWALEPSIECDDIVPVKDIFPKFALERVKEYSGNIGNTVFFYINEKAGMMDYKGNVKLTSSMDMYIDSRQGIASRKEYKIYNSEGEYVEQLYGGGGYSYIWNESDATLYSAAPGSLNKIDSSEIHEDEDFMQGAKSVKEGIVDESMGGIYKLVYNDTYRLVNKDCRLVIDEQLEDIKTDHSMGRYIIGNYAIVKKDGLWGYIKQDGTKLLDYSYEDAYPFFDGIAAVKKDGKAGFIKEDGQVAVDFMFEETRSVNEGLAWVKYDGKWGVIDIEKTMSGEEDNKKDDSINNEETTKVIEETISNTETTENNTKNPQTGDKNVYSLMMFMMFTIGIVTVIIMLNLKKKEE